MPTLKIGVLGSGSGTNMQSIQDAIDRGELDAKIVCVVADVPGALRKVPIELIGHDQNGMKTMP